MKIVASWFISPILAGAISVLLQLAIRKSVLDTAAPLRRAYVALPVLTGSTVAVLAMLILYQQSPFALWESGLMALGSGVVVWGVVQFCLLSSVRRRVEASTIEMSGLQPSKIDVGDEEDETEAILGDKEGASSVEVQVEGEGGEEGASPESEAEEKPASLARAGSEEGYLLASGPGLAGETEKAKRVFKYLQILTATLKSFAHGANDVANAAGPFAAVQGLYFGQDPCSISTTIWILMLCGAGIVLGLSLSGHHVIKTIGKDLTAIDFPTGFSIELGSTLSVVLASCTGMPVSSTHCQVGSVICIGVYENGAKQVEWKMLNKILLSWFCTVPISAVCAGGFLYVTLLLMAKL